MSNNTATTYRYTIQIFINICSIVGSLNKIPVSILGAFLFNQIPSHFGILGIIIGLSGGLVYTFVKIEEQSKHSLSESVKDKTSTTEQKV